MEDVICPLCGEANKCKQSMGEIYTRIKCLNYGVAFDVENDFSSEGDLLFIIWNLVSLYVTTEIKIAEAWSWASENVKRQAFTNESLKKIDEREEINTKRVRKENNIERFKTIVESINKRTMKKNKEE